MMKKQILLFSLILSPLFAHAAGFYAPGDGSLLFSSPRENLAEPDDRDWPPPAFLKKLQAAENDGYGILTIDWGGRATEDILLIDKYGILEPATDQFIGALGQEKRTLMKLTGLTNESYNKLAAMAYGIFGNETKFGRSVKYHLKETCQLCVQVYKAANAVINHGSFSSNSSRGGTQIKDIPERVARYYRLTPDNLTSYRNSAIATIAVLAEKLDQIERFKKHNMVGAWDANRKKFSARAASDETNYYEFMNEENIFDFIPVLYEGRGADFLACVGDFMNGYGTGAREKSSCVLADPFRSPYIMALRGHMKRLVILEMPATK